MHTTLYYRDERSDKIYRIAIEPRDGGYVVNFAYGRRGSTLNTGTKTSSPVYFDAARMIYDKLVKEKMARIYPRGRQPVLRHRQPKGHGHPSPAPQCRGGPRAPAG